MEIHLIFGRHQENLPIRGGEGSCILNGGCGRNNAPVLTRGNLGTIKDLDRNFLLIALSIENEITLSILSVNFTRSDQSRSSILIDDFGDSPLEGVLADTQRTGQKGIDVNLGSFLKNETVLVHEIDLPIGAQLPENLTGITLEDFI